MYPLAIPDFTKELVGSIGSKQIDLNNSSTYKAIINQIAEENISYPQSYFLGFWWDENTQRANHWFTKVQLTWHTELSDFQDIHRWIKYFLNKEEIDLSFQNGFMGFLLWLSRENQKNQDAVVDDFIEKSIGLLLSKKMKINTNWHQFSFFPEAFDDDTWTCNNILTWEVGDLHFVKLLYRRAKGNFNSYYYEIAENIGLQSTTRVREEQTQIIDSSLAKGSMGLAMLYKVLYHETGHQTYLKSSCHWLEKTETFLESELQNGYYTGRETHIFDGLAGIYIVKQELQKEELSPFLTYLAG